MRTVGNGEKAITNGRKWEAFWLCVPLVKPKKPLPTVEKGGMSGYNYRW